MRAYSKRRGSKLVRDVPWPVLEAIWFDDESYMAAILRKYPELIELQDRAQTCLLHIACRFDAHKVAILLIAEGVSVHHFDANGYTPAHEAASCEGIRMIELLWHEDAELLAETHSGWTPFDIARYYGNADVTDWIIDRLGRDRDEGQTSIGWGWSHAD